VSSKVEEELIGVAHEWDRSMVENDAEAVGRSMADDWTIIGPDGNVGDKATFLALVRSGALSHDVMESHDIKVRVYGDTAVVTARAFSRPSSDPVPVLTSPASSPQPRSRCDTNSVENKRTWTRS
jgi:hypothetical protein